MKVFNHHIYEYRKGIRNLFLCTLSSDYEFIVRRKLEKHNISFIIRPVNNRKINIFFGSPECINVLSSFGNKPLNEFTDKEDFMLGIMLGYDCQKQCNRYMERISHWQSNENRKRA